MRRISADKSRKAKDDQQNISLRSFEGDPYPESSLNRLLIAEEEHNLNRDAKNKYLFECHIPPMVWTRVQFGYRVQGMTDRHYFDVVNLIKEYMPTDPLLKTIDNQVDIDYYLETVFSWFPKTQSLVVVKEGSREIVGVLIGRLVIEPGWFEPLSQLKFVSDKDKYAHLKTCGGTDGKDVEKKTKSPPGKPTADRKPAKRESKASRRSSVKKDDGENRKSMKGGSRKSMGAKGGSRKSMGAKGGSRKSMGAKGGSRKSMGAGQRKSMGAGQRKSMGAGQRKSKGEVSRKSLGGGSRKSLGAGSRKSMTEKSPGKRGPKVRGVMVKGEWKISRPVDDVPEEEVPLVQAAIFDDDEVTYSNERLELINKFRKKLAAKFNVWKLISQRMYYRIYLVAVSPRYQRMEVDNALFSSLVHMCHAFNVYSITGVLTKYDSQNAFYNSGGIMIYEVLYKNYSVFEPCDPASYDRSAAVMYMDIRTVFPPPPPESDQQKPRK